MAWGIMIVGVYLIPVPGLLVAGVLPAEYTIPPESHEADNATAEHFQLKKAASVCGKDALPLYAPILEPCQPPRSGSEFLVAGSRTVGQAVEPSTV